MGASGFMEIEKGDDPNRLFKKLSNKQKRMNGGMYSGQINMKSGIRRRKKSPMPLKKARDFASEDRLKNDRDDPAYYVPFYEEEDTESVVVRVSALTEESAKEEAQSRAEGKTDITSTVETRVKTTEIVESGSLPNLDRERPSASDRERNEEWLVETKDPRHKVRSRLGGRARRDMPSPRHDTFESESSLREAIKEFFRRHPTAEVSFEMKRRWTDEIEHFSRSGQKPSQKPTHEVTVEVIPKAENPDTEGFVFYGMARE
jgi:hypothetical protein